MQNPNDTLDDFEEFMSSVKRTCERLKLNMDDYTNPFDFFQDVMSFVSDETLRFLDEQMGDDYLHDDILGNMHQAVRARLHVIRPILVPESGRSA